MRHHVPVGVAQLAQSLQAPPQVAALVVRHACEVGEELWKNAKWRPVRHGRHGRMPSGGPSDTEDTDECQVAARQTRACPLPDAPIGRD
eukprot:3459937-Pyramimonas_sp.AAC.1